MPHLNFWASKKKVNRENVGEKGKESLHFILNLFLAFVFSALEASTVFYFLMSMEIIWEGGLQTYFIFLSFI